MQGNNLMHLSCERGHLSCVQFLNELSPDLCEEFNKTKLTPAALAVKVSEYVTIFRFCYVMHLEMSVSFPLTVKMCDVI